MDPLITQLWRLGLGCRLLNDIHGCLLYADDIELMTHSIHAMQMMLHVSDTFADDFDIRFNNSKSVAMRIGKRFSVNCAALQIDNKDIKYVREVSWSSCDCSPAFEIFCGARKIEVFSNI